VRSRIATTISASESYALFEYQYGPSFTRFLNDGLDIGPGLAEKWEVSSDQKEFTFHFRKGLKWSDGEPWTTEDVMYWWEDMVLNEQQSDTPPDPTRDGKAEVATITAPDDYTVQIELTQPDSGLLSGFIFINIMPEHILGTVDRAKIAEQPFWTEGRIGAGPVHNS